MLGWSQNCGVGIQRIMDAYADASDYPQLRVGPGSVAVVLPILSRLHLSTDDDAQTAAPPAPAPTAKRYTFPAVSGEMAGPTNTAGPNIVWLVAPAPASASPAASLEAMTLRLLATAGLPLSRTEIETTLQLDKNRSTRHPAQPGTTGQSRPARGAPPRHAVSPRLTRHDRAALLPMPTSPARRRAGHTIRSFHRDQRDAVWLDGYGHMHLRR